MTLSKSSTKFCQPTETKKESRSLYPLLKVMMWIYEKFGVTVLSFCHKWAARPFHCYENLTFDQNHPARTFKSYIVCTLKGDGFLSKTLGPAGRGSDFWKASLVSVKILVEAALFCCVHSFQSILMLIGWLQEGAKWSREFPVFSLATREASSLRIFCFVLAQKKTLDHMINSILIMLVQN